jgi:hypothetical protein
MADIESWGVGRGFWSFRWANASTSGNCSCGPVAAVRRVKDEG